MLEKNTFDEKGFLSNINQNSIWLMFDIKCQPKLTWLMFDVKLYLVDV